MCHNKPVYMIKCTNINKHRPQLHNMSPNSIHVYSYKRESLAHVMKPITEITFFNVANANAPDDERYGLDDFVAVSSSVPPPPVPEPGTFGLLLIGGTALLGYSRRRSRRLQADQCAA